MSDDPARVSSSRWVLVGGPLGLALGFVVGALVHSGRLPYLAPLLGFFQPVGTLWMNALRVAVVPLTVCLLVLGVCSLPRGKDLGRWGSATFACFLALLVAGAALTLSLGASYLAAFGPLPIAVPFDGLAPSVSEPTQTGNWADVLMPSNLFAAAASGELLSLCVLAVLFGLALRTLPDPSREPVERLFAGVRDAVMVFVRWVVSLLPIGAFALALSFGAESGLRLAREIVHFALFASALMVAFGLLLMVASVIAGRFGWVRYIQALLPILGVAVGTRSSLATMPSVIDGAQSLGLPEPAVDLVIPTSTSLYKTNRIISSTAKVLFMAALFHVALGPATLAVFLGTIAILAFASPGIPSVATGSTFGAYLAAGIPPEGIVMFEVANSLTDFAKTALNVTADLAVAVFVARWAARGAVPEPAPAAHSAPI